MARLVIGYTNEMSSRLAQRLSRVSYFLGVASLAGWLIFYSQAEVRSGPLVIVVFAVLTAGLLAIVTIAPKARNLHGSAALASFAITLIHSVLYPYFTHWRIDDAFLVVRSAGQAGWAGPDTWPLQAAAALGALVFAALSFRGIKGTKTFQRLAPVAYADDKQAADQSNLGTPPAKGSPMIRFLEAKALASLWVITIANLGGGLLLWIFNFLRQVEAEFDIFDRLSNQEFIDVMESAAGWQLFAVPFIEFGILVLVITLATAAIVESTKKTGR